MLTTSLAVAMAVLDGSIANVALPAIARDLAVSPAEAVWVVNAYQLTITVLLLPLSSLGDSFGYRRVYAMGLALFTVASLGCALADSLTALAAARVVQGIGAAGIMSVNAALVRHTYPTDKLGRGVGVIALVVAGSAALGPSIAAGILSLGPWPWLFTINLPLGVLALMLWRTLPPTPGSRHPFDIVSALLNAATFGLFILAIDGLGQGEHLLVVALEAGGAVFAGFLLVRRELGRPNPLLPVDLLRIPIFALSISTSVCAFAAQMLAYVALPFYLQDVLGLTQVETGLLMTPWPATIMIVAPIAGRLADRYPSGLLGGIGMAVFAVGLVMIALLPPDPAPLAIMVRMAICGLGFALFQSPNNRTIIGAAPLHRSGGASGMLGTGRLTGQTTGTALVAVIFSLFTQDGALLSVAVGAGFALAAMGASLLRLAPVKPRS
jgi:MFS transporter, DHA2 family, multidrug resistance protein